MNGCGQEKIYKQSITVMAVDEHHRRSERKVLGGQGHWGLREAICTCTSCTARTIPGVRYVTKIDVATPLRSGWSLLYSLDSAYSLQPRPVSTWTGREAVKQGRQISMGRADFGVETRKPCDCKEQGARSLDMNTWISRLGDQTKFNGQWFRVILDRGPARDGHPSEHPLGSTSVSSKAAPIG